MKSHSDRHLPELRRVLLNCGHNIWGYPALDDPDFLHRVGLREAIRETASALPERIVVADLGCGWMPYKEWFLGADRTYIPLDVTAYPDHHFRIIRDGRIPLADASVDVLVCWQVLEHVHDMDSFFSEVRRILKPGGQAFFTTHGLFRIHDRQDFWRWTPEGLRLLLEGHGFAEFRARPCDTTYAVTASLLNNAFKPRGGGAMHRTFHRALCAGTNAVFAAADFLFDVLGFSGHRREATTYIVQVTRAPIATTAATDKQSAPEGAAPSVRVCVAICTRNRAADLSRLLPSLRALDYPTSLLEFTIVDNASTDNTAQIAVEWCNKQRNAKYFREPRPGLPFARNLAWQKTDAELVVYLDDDAIPRNDWLTHLTAAYTLEKDRRPSRLLAVGGSVKLCLPDHTSTTASWLGDDMLGWLSELDYGPDTFVLDKPLMNLMGANFAVPRRTLEQLGGFCENLPGYGGDERYIENKIREKGGVLVYVGSAAVYHYIGAEKITPKWFRQRLVAEGRAVTHLRLHKCSSKLTSTLRIVATGLRSLASGAFALVRYKANPDSHRFSQSCRLWFAYGLLTELFDYKLWHR